MYKLIGHGLTKGERFEPESQPMALQERGSTCTITLGPEAPAISFGDWLLDDEWPEGPIVWRVKDIGDDITGETRTLELEHVINALEDISLFGEVTPKTITGNSGATTCTAEQAITYLLGLHGDWTLGGIEYDVSNPYEFDGDTIYDAVESVTDTLEDAEWEYDMSVYPFKLYIRQRDTDVSCEMRQGRNLSTLKRKISRSGMYTRLYPIGQNNLYIDGDYVSQNETTYGRVDKIETDQSKTTKAGLLAWANGLIRRHCEPTVTITISGLELSQETGEALDALRMNRVCRAPLPEYGTTITERIVKLQWRDRKKEPENVTVTLANNSQDVTTIIRKASKANGKSKKGNAKQNYLFEANGEHLYYEIFDESGHLHGLLRMTEESFRLAFDNLDTSMRSEFLMTAESLRITFEDFQESVRSEFIQKANLIGMVVDTTDPSNPYIKAAEIVAEVNKDGSTVRLNANRIKVGDGSSTVTLNNVMTINGDYTRMTRPVEFGNANATVRTQINGGTVTAQHYKTTSGGDIEIYKSDGSGPFTVNYASWAALLTGVTVQGGNSNSFTIVDNSGNTYKIEKSGDDLLFKDVTNDVSWTFSKAAPGTISGDWGGTTANTLLTLTDGTNNYYIRFGGQDAGASQYLGISAGNVDTDYGTNGFNKTAMLIKVPINLKSGTYNSSSRDVTYSTTRHTQDVYVDGTAAYNVGKNDGSSDVTLNEPTWNALSGATIPSSRTVTVSTSGRKNSSGTTDNLEKTVTVDVSVDSSKAYIKHSGTTVAEIAHSYKYTESQYNNAENVGRNAVTLEEPTWNALNSGTIPSSRTVAVKTSGRKNTSGTTDNLTKTVTVDVSVDSSKAYIKHSGTTVAEVAHSYKYTQAQYNTALATVPSGYTAKSATTITNGNINAASIGVYSGHYACNMNLTLNFGDGTTRSADVSGGVIVDDIVAYGQAIGGGGCGHSQIPGGKWAFQAGTTPDSSGNYTHRLWITTKSATVSGLSDGSSYYLYK